MQAVYITKRGSYNWIKNVPVKPTYCEMPCRHACKCQDLEQKYNEEIKLAKANSIPFEIQIAAESLIADNDDWCLDDISVIKQPISIHSIWVANTEGIVGNPEIYKEDRMMVARIVPYKVFGEPFETDIAEKHVNESLKVMTSTKDHDIKVFLRERIRLSYEAIQRGGSQNYPFDEMSVESLEGMKRAYGDMLIQLELGKWKVY